MPSDPQIAARAALDRRLVDERPPAEAARPCADPVRIPSGRLAAGATERLWRQDRVALVSCGRSKNQVLEFYADRDARIAADPARPGLSRP